MPDLGPTASFLDRISDRLVKWADLSGGVTSDVLKQMAFECRSEAFRLRCMKGER